jgi:uncharacterized protein YqeY
MAIKEQILEDIKAAMRAKDSSRLSTLRLVAAAIKQKEVDERISLDDAAVISVLEKMVKQRKDSISQFQAGGREDLVAIEAAELTVLSAYLPEQMSEAELLEAVAKAVADAGATGPQDMGRAMAMLKPVIAGKADMGLASKMLKARLSP